MKKVGILGGTFNPPHLGHLIMANEAFHAAGLDEVRFMPNAIPPHKEISGATAEQRLRMTELAIEGHPQFKLEDFEIASGGVSYTYDTLENMIKREPDNRFYFIIGGDSIEDLDNWHRIDELQELVQFVGIRRPGYEYRSSRKVLMIDTPEIRLSSTILRARVAAGQTLEFLVPGKVEAYIRKERLYGSEFDAPES